MLDRFSILTASIYFNPWFIEKNRYHLSIDLLFLDPSRIFQRVRATQYVLISSLYLQGVVYKDFAHCCHKTVLSFRGEARFAIPAIKSLHKWVGDCWTYDSLHFRWGKRIWYFYIINEKEIDHQILFCLCTWYHSLLFSHAILQKNVFLLLNTKMDLLNIDR